MGCNREVDFAAWAAQAEGDRIHTTRQPFRALFEEAWDAGYEWWMEVGAADDFGDFPETWGEAQNVMVNANSPAFPCPRLSQNTWWDYGLAIGLMKLFEDLDGFEASDEMYRLLVDALYSGAKAGWSRLLEWDEMLQKRQARAQGKED